MSTLTHRIKSRAIELGFSKVGICRADCLTREAERLMVWLQNGYSGDMEYMRRNPEKRSDPRKVMSSVKSVVSLAMNYNADVNHPSGSDIGKISRYAWGDDYHLVIEGKLNQLLEFIKAESHLVEGRVYVDTGPVMEKAWAVRAGIGWQGKNTNLLTREFGSWVFLAEILLNVELGYDNPIAGLCGSCARCVDACPTGAIALPYVLDSNLCISYLTIELGSGRQIPEDLKGQIGNWIFGCDICQDVCPWNIKFAKSATEKSFYPREGNMKLVLTELLAMAREEFGLRFSKSAVKRRKLEGFLRNVEAAVGRMNITQAKYP
jgi:epoxyqueuosine reductase